MYLDSECAPNAFFPFFEPLVYISTDQRSRWCLYIGNLLLQSAFTVTSSMPLPKMHRLSNKDMRRSGPVTLPPGFSIPVVAMSVWWTASVHIEARLDLTPPLVDLYSIPGRIDAHHSTQFGLIILFQAERGC